MKQTLSHRTTNLERKLRFNVAWLVAILFGVGAVACGDDENNGSTANDSSSDSSGSDSNSAGTGNTSGPSGSSSSNSNNTGGTGASGTGGSGGSSGMGSAGTDSLASGSDTASSGPVCEISALSVFARSDTDQGWDDNDFSDVTTEGTCPVLLNVTWPHEAGWENADPAEANHEQVHFTLDSYYSTDLTGKQLNLTIELVEDVRGPEATAGGYEIGLVSVSSYQTESLVPVETSSISDPGDAGVAADASVDAVETGSDAGAGEVPMMTVVSTGYAEAASAVEDRVILRHVGDRGTVKFALPNKEAPDSYDPASVIKINARIYNMFAEPEPESMETGDVDAGIVLMGDAGVMETDETLSNVTSTSETSSSGGSSASASSSGASSTSAASTTLDMSTSDTASTDTVATTGPQPHIYGYLTSKFAITAFTVTDAE